MEVDKWYTVFNNNTELFRYNLMIIDKWRYVGIEYNFKRHSYIYDVFPTPEQKGFDIEKIDVYRDGLHRGIFRWVFEEVDEEFL